MTDSEKSSAVLSEIEAGNKITDYELKKVTSRHSSEWCSPHRAHKFTDFDIARSCSQRNQKNKDDISERISLERADNSDNSSTVSTSPDSPDSTRKVISFDHDDPDNPFNWHWVRSCPKINYAETETSHRRPENSTSSSSPFSAS